MIVCNDFTCILVYLRCAVCTNTEVTPSSRADQSLLIVLAVEIVEFMMKHNGMNDFYDCSAVN